MLGPGEAAGRGLFFFVWFPFLLPQPSLSGQPGLSDVLAPSPGPALSPHRCSWRQAGCTGPDTAGLGIRELQRQPSPQPTWEREARGWDEVLSSPRSAAPASRAVLTQQSSASLSSGEYSGRN